MRKTTAVFFHTVVPGRASFVTFLTCKYAVPLKRKHHLLCVYVRTCCCCSIRRTPSAGTDFLIFVFLPQRAPLAPLWPLRAPTRGTPPSIACQRAFSSLVFRRRACFSILFFVFVGLLFYTYVRTCCRRASTASTAQHSAIRPARDRKSSTCRSERQNPSKQTDLARASI